MKGKLEDFKHIEEEQREATPVSSNTDYKVPKSPEYYAIRLGLVILGFAIGIIVSSL